MMDGNRGIKWWKIGKWTEIAYDTENPNKILIRGSLADIEMKGDPWNKYVLDVIRIYGIDSKERLTEMLIDFLKWAECDKEVIKFLEEEREKIEALFEAVSTAYKNAQQKIQKELEERKKKVEWWEQAKKKLIATFYKKEIDSMRDTPTSVYLDDYYKEKGNKELIKLVKKEGELIDSFYVKRQFQTATKVDIYKLGRGAYAIETYWFTNRQGMYVEQEFLYELRESP